MSKFMALIPLHPSISPHVARGGSSYVIALLSPPACEQTPVDADPYPPLCHPPYPIANNIALPGVDFKGFLRSCYPAAVVGPLVVATPMIKVRMI